MLEEIHLKTPLTDDVIERLYAGTKVLISGELYTARDAAHKRLSKMITSKKELPFDIKGAIIYYVGPTPAKPGHVIGSAGPTSSYRMDIFTPALIELGLKGMIGKGPREEPVKKAIKKFKAIYFAAIGGAGALLSEKIINSEVIAFKDLGTEAIRKLEVKDFPAIIVNDVFGNDLFEQGNKQFKR